MTLHEQWLFKAEHDLKSAVLLFNSGLYDTAIYHTQQCAEKSLKSYLTFKHLALVKSHNLDLLCRMCQKYDKSFDDIYLDAVDLNGFDVEFRYPGIKLEPSKEDVRVAINLSENIFNFIKNKIATPSV